MQLINIGFGNIIKEKKISLIYKNSNNTYKIDVNIDIRKQLKNQNYVLEITDELPENIEDGEYNVYLSIGEPYESLKDNSNYYIKLANKNVWNEETKGNYLGKVTIGKNTIKNEDNSSNNIIQNTNNESQMANIKLFIGIGIIVFIVIVLLIIIIIKSRKNMNLSIK